MRVLTFTSLFPNNIWPRQGLFIKERMSQVARLGGCDVRVVAPVPYFPSVKVSPRWRFSQVVRHEMISGLEVYHPRFVMTPKIGMSTYGVTMFLSVARHVLRVQRKFDFDIIDAHFLYPDGFAAVMLGRLCHKPVVVSARGSDVNVYGEMPLIRRLLRYTLRQADGVIAVSAALKNRMVRLGVPEAKVNVVPNGVDAAKFFSEGRVEARRALGLPLGSRLVLSVGGLVPVKGFDVLVDAVHMLAARGRSDDLRLVIIGDGPERKSLQARVRKAGIGDRVTFAGEVANERLRWWYSAADVFSLASRREGCPNVILEALACGTPVVASAVGGIPEMVQSPDLGILCDGSRDGLAAALDQALAATWHSNRIAEFARERYSWRRSVDGVTQVLRSVTRHAAGEPQPAVSDTMILQVPRRDRVTKVRGDRVGGGAFREDS